jgi:glycosyltransferase involved in cell wall biosynthesis
VQLAQGILKLADDPALRLEMAKNGVQAVESFYSWKSQEDKLLKLYQRVSETLRGNY